MATTTQIKEFIAQITPILQREAKKRGYKIVSPAIAQALQESLSSKSKSGISKLAEKYHNYHGMKCGNYWLECGKPSVNMKTNEEYKVGTLTPITDFFRVFSNMEAGLVGYYEFLEMKRYSKVRKASTPEKYMEEIKAANYCTSSTYIKNCLDKIKKYNLTQYDNMDANEETHAQTPEPITVTYTAGRTYTLKSNMYVRTEPRGKKKTLAEITADGRKNAYKDGAGAALLKKGTRVTIQSVETNDDGSVWVEIPSGYVCGIDSGGKVYIA